MLAICKSNLGSAIPLVERYLGEVDQTDYSPLKVGDSYVVYALLFISDRVDFLVRVPGQPPFWAPSSLFNLVDARVSADWELCMTQSKAEYKILFDVFKISRIMGYSLLVNDYNHYVGIVEQDPVEIQRFAERELDSTSE